MLAMLRKRAQSSRVAASEFTANKREDLAEKQEAEIKVLDEYAGQVDSMSGEDVARVVDHAVRSVEASGAKTNLGLILKELLKPGGSLQGKPVEKSMVAEMVKKRLS